MPLVSINILTKNRCKLLARALESVHRQTFGDYEIVLVNDGSTDETGQTIDRYVRAGLPIVSLFHLESKGITASRREALAKSSGPYVAFLDDDDEWTDPDKLKKQVAYLDSHPKAVVVGGGIVVESQMLNVKGQRYRPQHDWWIRMTMLLRNNFFTSTVVARREAIERAGGWVSDAYDLGEDYDLWLRMGKLGSMHNFREVFTRYTAPQYGKDRFRKFLEKQLSLVRRHKDDYPLAWLSMALLKIRIFI